MATTLFFVLILSFTISGNCATYHKEDPKNDVYEISALDFLYVLGDEFPDRPDDIDDVEKIINKLVLRSEIVNSPDSIDIEEIYINNDDATYYAVIVEMQNDIKDSDYVKIIGILENDNGDWIEFEMEWDESDGSDYEWTSEDFEGNDTTGGLSGKQMGIALPKSECPNWDEDMDYVVIAFTIEGDFDDPFHSMIYYDFAPNSIAPPPEEQLLYQGWEPITGYIAQFAQFLFGSFAKGHLSFLLLIAIIITFSQILFDRKNKIMHIIGMILLILTLYPIFFYSIFMNLVGVLGFIDIFALLSLISLLFFAIFIILSLCNNFGLIKRYRTSFVIAIALMIAIEIIYLIFYMNQAHIIYMFVLTGISLSLWISLIISKKLGRNIFKN